jgi:hypothetical protein
MAPVGLAIVLGFLGASCSGIEPTADLSVIRVGQSQQDAISAFLTRYPGQSLQSAMQAFGIVIDDGQGVIYHGGRGEVILVNLDSQLPLIEEILGSWDERMDIIEVFEQAECFD